MPIPRILHFIWIGTPLPLRLARNIAKWTMENPWYRVQLWTETSTMDKYAHLMADELSEVLVINEDREEVITYIKTDGDAITVELVQKDLELARLIIRTISTIPPIINPVFLAEEMSTWKNYGAASDILRFSILHHEGGTYMDCDTYSTGVPLPLHISPQKGILFSTLSITFTLATAVISSYPNSPLILDIANYIEHAYSNFNYKSILGDGVFSLSLRSKKLLWETRELRARYSQLSPEKRSEKNTIGIALYDGLGNHTMETSGPIMLYWWLFKLLQTFPHAEDIEMFSYQTQTGYQLKIDSERVWFFNTPEAPHHMPED